MNSKENERPRAASKSRIAGAWCSGPSGMCPRYRLRPGRPSARGPSSLATMTSGSAPLAHSRDQVDHALQAFLAQQHEVLLATGQDLLPGTESISALLAGGKRLRPAFCYWGWRGAGGPDCSEIFRGAAALE